MASLFELWNDLCTDGVTAAVCTITDLVWITFLKSSGFAAFVRLLRLLFLLLDPNEGKLSLSNERQWSIRY